MGVRIGRSGRRGLGIGALALAVAVGSSPPLEAQARRGAQQRTPRAVGQADGNARAQNGQTGAQGQVLLDRFARRVGEALHLDGTTTERLLRELQESRSQRRRINARIRAGRLELGQLIQETPADEDRIGAVMDELLDLELRRAQVTIDEQRRLAEFLSPLQRARIVWLQRQAARQALERGRDGSLR